MKARPEELFFRTRVKAVRARSMTQKAQREVKRAILRKLTAPFGGVRVRGH
jgi:hypothetical protein